MRRPVRLLVAVSVLCLSLAPGRAGAAAPDAALTELRNACFEHLAQGLARSPLKDVPWPTGKNVERVTFRGADAAKETLRADSGGMVLDLKWKSIDNRQLAGALRVLSETGAAPDGKAAGLAAALLAADGAPEAAAAFIEKANQRDISAQAEYDSWRKKLDLGEKPKPRPAAAPATPPPDSKTQTAAKPETVVAPAAGARHPVPKEHPRLFGSKAYLQGLATARAAAFKKVEEMANSELDDSLKMPSLALVSAVKNDAALATKAVALAMNYVNGPIKTGHVPFGGDLALCALVYDLCYEAWTPEQRAKFHEYMNKTVDSNVDSETHVFHNGFYGYKNWGIGLACYATMYENPRAADILKKLEDDVRARAVPALEMAGDGGGWAEGHYVHYWLYEWLVFCEVARACEGVDYYALAPKFFSHRAIASMFEMFPGGQPHEVNCPIPMGDGGYGTYGGFSEKILAARRILVDYYRNDPAHQAASAYNHLVPTNSIPQYAYMNFLWNDPTVPKGNLKEFKLSHFSPGPGYVHARSSWDADATYFFFKCGPRFTAHQHLDVGHFLIYRHEQLAGDGGVYDSFNSNHCCNYYIRSIAHNTMLVYDPAEKFPDGIRACPKAANDGGQAYPWLNTPVGHNGGVADVAAWQKNRKLLDIGEMLAYEDAGAWMYAAGDCTRAYAPQKLDAFTRQIVFLRPGTFVIFDRVKSKNPNLKKTWLLQAMKPPTGTAPELTVTNGKGRLFIQTLLPEKPQVKLCSGAELYAYGGQSFPPAGNASGPVPECRIEVSPSAPSDVDFFLHVLTATDASVASVPRATVKTGSEITVTVGATTITFQTAAVGGKISGPGGTATLKNLAGPR